MNGEAAAALGIAPHSGWAAAVLLAGTAASPRVLLRERIELADTALPGSRQPYHALESVPLPQAQQQLSAFCASARQLAACALRSLLERANESGVTARSIGILDSAGRSGASLEAILASHALIHTADGNHFRDALAEASSDLGLEVSRIAQRDLAARASAALGRSPDELAAKVKRLGGAVGSPWGADQKSAALVAWLLLAPGPGERVGIRRRPGDSRGAASAPPPRPWRRRGRESGG